MIMFAVKILSDILLFLLLPGFVKSQELNCNVQVSAQRIQGSNRQVFENMQRDIYEFMNNTYGQTMFSAMQKGLTAIF